MTAISPKMLKTRPAANHPITLLPRYPFLKEITVQAIPQMELITRMNVQLAASIRCTMRFCFFEVH